MAAMIIAALALALGQVPPPEFEQQVRADMVTRLVDAESARYIFPEVRNDALYCFWLNARNRNGGYVGYMPVQVRRTAEGGLDYQIASPFDYTATLYSRECARAGYLPPS
jgi:hypothetical protein